MTPFFLAFVPPLTLFAATALGGPALFLPAIVLFGVVPLLDQVLPQNRDNTAVAGWVRSLANLCVLAHIAAVAFALYTVVHGGLSPAPAGVLVLGTGFAGAAAINVAHDLMHRPGRVPQALAAVLLSTVLYAHFCVEHVQGHHKRVGTLADPATSRLGESLFRFLPRSLSGGLRSAWAIEWARVGLATDNRMIRYGLGQAVLVAGIGLGLGPLGLAAFVGQAVVAVLMLETINYIEHYGLIRAEVAPGRFERVRPEHSWNSSHRVSNWMLLNLARHSDHHAFPARPFTELRHHDDVPQLPCGYSAMLLLATIPPLWFRVMDPRVRTASKAIATGEREHGENTDAELTAVGRA